MRGSQFMEVLDPASSAAACAAFWAEAAEVVTARGSGGPVFCIAGFGRAWAWRRASAALGSMARNNTGLGGVPGREALPPGERTRIIAQIAPAGAAASSNSRYQRGTTALMRENIMRKSCRCNIGDVKLRDEHNRYVWNV